MTLMPNTHYVYEFAGDIFLTHHTENGTLFDYRKLTNTTAGNKIVNWKYDPSRGSHGTIVFHELEAYKLQHPELFI